MRNDFTSNYLAHHGILGMKWGKKNGPPYPLGASDHSASEKKAGYKKSLGGGRNEELYNRKTNSSKKDHRSSARKFITGEYDTNKKSKELSAKREKEINAIARPKDNEWYDEKTGWTNKAREYMSKVDKVDEKYRKKEDALYEELNKEIENTRKDLLFSDDIKADTLKARELNKQIRSLRDDILGENSKNAEKAYKQYLKDHPDSEDAEYAFFHYKWRSGNEAYDKSAKEYEQKVDKVWKQYDSTIKTIGEKIVNAAGDMKPSDIKVDEDFIKFEIDQIISFRDEYFKEEKKK